MKLRARIALIGLALLLALGGCSKPAGTPAASATPGQSAAPQVSQAPSLSAKELFEQVSANIELPNFMEMSAEEIAENYGVDVSKCESYYVGLSPMNVHANEVAIFRLKDAADTQAFVEGCKQEAQRRAKAFEQYLPEPYELATNPTIQTQGNYVFMAIDANAAAMAETFKTLVAG